MGSTQPRFLFVVNHSDFFLSHRLPIALMMQQKGYEVHVATMPTSAAGELREYGITWHSLPLEVRSMDPVKDLRLLFALVRLYRELQPSIIHHVTIKPVLYGSIAARLTRMPAVVNALSGLGYLFIADDIKAKVVRPVVRNLLKYAFAHPNSKLILQNSDDVEDFVDRGILNRNKVALIRGSGVDTDKFSPSQSQSEKSTVILPSRLLWDKGVGEFVEAASLLEGKGVRFVLVGAPDPNNPNSISEDRLQTWENRENIEWWGFREDMPNVLGQACVVCLPSYREGLPKVLLEAASCGRPIVTTDVPGCREIVQHGKNGLLVPPKDPKALAQAICQLIQDPELRERMGDQGRKLVLENFSLEKVKQQTSKVYQVLEN